MRCRKPITIAFTLRTINILLYETFNLDSYMSLNGAGIPEVQCLCGRNMQIYSFNCLKRMPKDRTVCG